MKPIQALQRYFGLKSFRNSQLEIIESIIKGENVLAVLPQVQVNQFAIKFLL